MSAGARTLIVSDLHLGARLGRDVLRRAAALAALLDALDGVQRLVLLGDVVELVEGDPRAGARRRRAGAASDRRAHGRRARDRRRPWQPRRRARPPLAAHAPRGDRGPRRRRPARRDAAARVAHGVPRARARRGPLPGRVARAARVGDPRPLPRPPPDARDRLRRGARRAGPPAARRTRRPPTTSSRAARRSRGWRAGSCARCRCRRRRSSTGSIEFVRASTMPPRRGGGGCRG